ncbi:MAG: HYR domain-containing protein [Blastocatellia bacterium]
MKACPNSRILCLIRNLRKIQFAAIFACVSVLILITMMMRAPFSSAQTSETLTTFASNCTTPKTFFNLGDTVCVVATDTPLGPPAQRKFEWVTPNGEIFQFGPEITSDPQNVSITIPSSGPSAQVGTWTVKTVDVSNNGYATARFVVQDPNNASVDLWTPLFAPSEISAGSSASFTVFVTNKGPNDAQNVELTVTVATNSTFMSETQLSGPAFSCTNPSVGSTGSSTCTVATLPANSTAVLQFIFQVDAGATAGAEVSSTATVSSSTTEIFAADNTFTATATITPQTCDITCPSDITMGKDAGQCGAVITFSTPVGSGPGCGTIECSPPSGGFFPIGTTNVICFGNSGTACSFAVTIQDSQPATITCPSNITVNESSPGQGFAVVNYPAPTLNDNCPAPLSACNPPAGSSFPVGTTTVTCETSAGSGSPVTCSFTVTVNSTQCILNCTQDIVVPANPTGSGSATVTYSSPTANGCPTLTITCTPPSGSVFPLGTTAVTCEGVDGSNNTVASCGFNVTVINAAPCTITCPANITVSNDPGLCGAEVSYPSPATTGNCGDAPNCSPASGSFFPVGTTIITCTTDAGPQCSFSITVVDTQSPVITCPASITATAVIGQTSAVVTFSTPVASDNCPGASVACLPPSGSSFSVGVTTVTCTATDASAHQTSCTFKVAVSGTLVASADTFLRDGADNTNEGGNDRLRIQSSGHNRVLARFNLSGISTTGLQSATLILRIASNLDNWGSSGRPVDAHRLTADWTEGNGINDLLGILLGFRGTGEGATWKCAKDTNIHNFNDDCTTPWNGGTFAAATSPSKLHTNNLTGDVSWNVKADVQAGASFGWLIKKQSEGQNGQVRYYSREAGNANLAPRLVLVYTP